MARIYVVGTADTKGEELLYLAGRIKAAGGDPLIVDVGVRQSPVPAGVAAGEVARHGPPGTAEALASGERGAAVSAMARAFAAFIPTRSDIGGVVGIGGGGGTSIVTAGMRELPFGVPKIMVSTLASGDVSAFVDVSDIVMMPAVTDFAGLNRISRAVLHNAAEAIAAMALRPPSVGEERPALAITMFGVTTPCATAVAEAFRGSRDCLVFHATGTGGRTMEKLVDSGVIEGVIDVTTTEVADFLVGGVLSAGADRLGAAARTKTPYVGSVGALDMVNFWAPETVPERFRGRTFHRHNPNVTLMRTTAGECRAIGAWIGAKLNLCEGQVRILLPEKGVSALDVAGGAFFDPEADAALFDAIESTIVATERRQVRRLPLHVNDPAFAAELAAAYREIC